MRISSTSPLVLGSASPRRRDLLALVGVPFVTREARIDETPEPGEEPVRYSMRIARAKLEAVRSGVDPERLLLVADTIVIAPDGGLLGKPRDQEAALAMIERLAGGTHRVSTCFIVAAGTSAAHVQTVTTAVTFRALCDGEASRYAATGEGLDKAGAYAIQGRAAAFVERIDGSYTNVVGLPLCEVLVALRPHGWFGDR